MKISIKNTIVSLAIATVSAISLVGLFVPATQAKSLTSVDEQLSTVSYNSCPKDSDDHKSGTHKPTSTQK
jgi:hypothetical protein